MFNPLPLPPLNLNSNPFFVKVSQRATLPPMADDGILSHEHPKKFPMVEVNEVSNAVGQARGISLSSL